MTHKYTTQTFDVSTVVTLGTQGLYTAAIEALNKAAINGDGHLVQLILVDQHGSGFDQLDGRFVAVFSQ